MNPTRWKSVVDNWGTFRLRRVEIITHSNGKKTEYTSYGWPPPEKEHIHPIRLSRPIWKPPRLLLFIFTT